MTNQEKTQQLKEAMNLIFEAQSIIQEVAEGDAWAEAYILPVFDDLLGNGNRYNPNLPQYIEELNWQYEDDE